MGFEIISYAVDESVESVSVCVVLTGQIDVVIRIIVSAEGKN